MSFQCDGRNRVVAVFVTLVALGKVIGYARCDVCMGTRLNSFSRGAGYHDVEVVGGSGGGKGDVGPVKWCVVEFGW